MSSLSKAPTRLEQTANAQLKLAKFMPIDMIHHEQQK
jgi:hypothetical protein